MSETPTLSPPPPPPAEPPELEEPHAATATVPVSRATAAVSCRAVRRRVPGCAVCMPCPFETPSPADSGTTLSHRLCSPERARSRGGGVRAGHNSVTLTSADVPFLAVPRRTAPRRGNPRGRTRTGRKGNDVSVARRLLPTGADRVTRGSGRHRSPP